jgi:aryl-alcohol dehydrogenase-like predicted oxidoreductase
MSERLFMQQRPFGKTGISVSALGLGCSPLGGGLFRNDRQESLRVVHSALDRGVTFFDTADNYSLGESERLLGTALRGRRDQAVIATKVGAVYGTADRMLLKARPILRPLKGLLGGARRSINLVRDKRKHYDFSPAHLQRAVEASLRRLGTDYIDIYQLYNPSAEDLREFAMGATLEKLRQAGKIRCFGITANHARDAVAALECESIASIQLPVSLLDQEGLAPVLEQAQTRGLAIIGSTPLGQGLLTNAAGTTKADESSHFTTDQIAIRRRLMATYRQRYVTPQRSLAQLALCFVLQTPGVTVAIPSAVSIAELDENLGALALPRLSDQEMRELVQTPRAAA